MDLYIVPLSPPCRVVLLAANTLKLNLNIKTLDLQKGDHLTPEYLKLNPQHTVPTLNDAGFVLWESRAIITYLANKYGGRDDPLYPKDPKQRAIVDQRLYFDATTFGPAFSECYIPVIFGKASEVNPESLKKLQKNFEFFETFLDYSEFAAGDNFTLADISLIVTVSSIDACKFDLSPYPRVSVWYKKAKEMIPGYKEVNEDVLKLATEMYEKNINK